MKGKTHSTEEIIRILRQADGGETAQSVCREHNISEQTFYWCADSTRKCNFGLFGLKPCFALAVDSSKLYKTTRRER